MDGSAILYPEGWHWNKQTLSVAVDPTLHAWEPYVDTALARWSRLCGLEFVKTAHVPDADLQIAPLMALNPPPGARAWSLLWGQDGASIIERGFVGLPPAPPADAAWMALHELGHVLGLSHPHQEDLGLTGDHSLTVMAYNPAAGAAAAEEPAPLDVAAIQALYGPDRIVLADGDGQGGPGWDRIQGGAVSDTLHGDAGDDTMYGAQGADVLLGGGGGDRMHGGRDDDRLYGNSGADGLYGDLGNDTLHGGQGDDNIDGGMGDDWLSGDAGKDVLIGGAGADCFAMVPGGGFAQVLDFNAAQGDRIALPANAVYAIAKTVDGDAIVVANGTMLHLDGVSATGITSDWFLSY